MNLQYISDKNGWTELSWEYTADGTEEYMYIGNFQSNTEIDLLYTLPDSIDQEDHHPSYYYVDDVYVGTEILSVSGQGYSLELTLWPNPVRDVLTLATESAIEMLGIYSVHGALIQTNSMNHRGPFELDVHSLAAGSYVLVATDQDGYKTTKHFVKR